MWMLSNSGGAAISECGVPLYEIPEIFMRGAYERAGLRGAFGSALDQGSPELCDLHPSVTAAAAVAGGADAIAGGADANALAAAVRCCRRGRADGNLCGGRPRGRW